MGNCQAAEAATVVMQHRDGKIERAYWSLAASQVMASNPGHYVAVIVTSILKSTGSSNSNSSRKAPVRYLKLLRPEDTLLVGHVYRLVSFEEVLREFGSKKHVKLSRLLAKQKENTSKRETRERGGGRGGENSNSEESPAMVGEQEQREELQTTIGGEGRSSNWVTRHGQWRPNLQSIAEIGN